MVYPVWQPGPYPMPVSQPPRGTAHKVIAWIVAMLTALYMLPWAIAATRNTKNAPIIALVNFLTGWTGAGWLGTLIWACVDADRTVVKLATAALSGPPAPLQPIPAYPPIGGPVRHGRAAGFGEQPAPWPGGTSPAAGPRQVAPPPAGSEETRFFAPPQTAALPSVADPNQSLLAVDDEQTKALPQRD